jgi:acetolactate synthase I/II/III large subunit
MKVHKALAKAIAAERCGALFCVMGDGNMHLMTALAELGVPIVNARHEAAAVAMADGYSRASGSVGVAAITCGPGLTQVGTSLMAARRAGSQVLVWVGDTPARDSSGLQDFDQRPFVEAAGGRFVPLTSSKAALADLRDAWVAAADGSGPVVFNAPMDLQDEHHDWPWAYESVSSIRVEHQRIEPDPAVLECAADTILGAQRPVVVVGRGAVASGAIDAIELLARRIGALLGTTLPVRGVFYGHEFDLGVVGTLCSAPTERLLAEADLVLAFGASLGHFTTDGGRLFPQATVLCVDDLPRYASRTDHTLVRGDARQVALALHDAIAQQEPEPRAGFRTNTTRAIFAERPERPPAYAGSGTGLDPRALMKVVGNEMPDDAQVVCGLGHYWSFAAMYLRPRPQVRDIFVCDFGAIGQALPVAIGAAIADRDRPVLLLEGDGSLMMHAQELDTMARYGLDVTLVVLNDTGFGAEAQKLRAQGLKSDLASIGTPNFGALGEVMGCRNGGLVDDIADFAECVREAFAAPGPTVIDARIDRHLPSDPYLRLYFGQANAAPRLAPEIAGPSRS